MHLLFFEEKLNQYFNVLLKTYAFISKALIGMIDPFVKGGKQSYLFMNTLQKRSYIMVFI